MKEYTISVLVRKPGGTYTFGPHDGATVVSETYEEALEAVKEIVEAQGWEVERPLRIQWKPCPALGEEGGAR